MPRDFKFQRAPQAVTKLAALIIKKYHKELAEAKVTIDFVFCRADTNEHGIPKTNAINHHGHAAYGVASIVGLLDRAMGRADAMIKIDADAWDKMNDKQQDALLDHEINHFKVKTDELGARLYDDLNRPRLEMRKHDYEIGLFKVIAERHGIASIEVQTMARLKEQAGQAFWPEILQPA